MYNDSVKSNKFLIDRINQLTSNKVYLNVSEWAQQKRYLPPDLTPMPGYWDNKLFPYLQEIMDCFSTTSSIKHVAFMKGAQIGASTGVLENILGYVIDHAPGPTMYVTADKGLSEQSIELKIDKLLTFSKLHEKIFSQSGTSNNKYSKKTGNSTQKKEFPGGFLIAVGARSPAKLRQISIKNLLLDEVDGYPHEVGKEGDPILLATARTNAYSSIRKILYISTPTVLQTSRINQLYLDGDQRKYFVPCKHCNEYQELIFSGNEGDKKYGIIFERDSNENVIIDSVKYICKFCFGEWKNSDKSWFLPRGKWKATNISNQLDYRSYHLNALYSPAGFFGWIEIVELWVKAQGNTERLKAFINTVLGECWEEMGDALVYQKIMRNRADYMQGEIPKEVLFLTAAADVHKDRIDVEILGWADNCVSYSIDWLHFEGKTDTVEGDGKTKNAWVLFKDFLLKGHYPKKILCAFIDCGFNTDAVYTFCAECPTGVFPVKGEGRNLALMSAYQTRKVAGYKNLMAFRIQVDFYKDRLIGRLNLELKTGSAPPFGYCFYPANYDDKYFEQYSNEAKVEKRDAKGKILGYVWKRRSSKAANHAWDCRVYNLAAFDYLVDWARDHYTNPDLSIEDFFAIFKSENK